MYKIFAIIGISTVALAACSSVDRLSMVGKTPRLSDIEANDMPQRESSLAYQDIPQGATIAADGSVLIPNISRGSQDTSLYRTGSKAFFRDQRAARTGDILTVKINIADKAQVDNTTTRTRTNSENAQAPALFGLESVIAKSALKANNLANLGSQSRSTGNGQIQRADTINLTVAALVTGVLPNGNLLIKGRQEVRVNFEVRELIIAGIVRPEDITRDNTIMHSQIAEARIAYGGRGQLSDVQQARYGQQILDAVMPF
jgi:flagellar L-ring protein FlgH